MTFFHEPGNGFGPAFHMKLIKDIRQVVFYRLITQAEMDGDLLICFPFSQQRQNEPFLRRQSGDALGIHAQV
ncbi:hypothetical protein YTPLAS72_26930 [Nitrospira sp.]|nr:hypothetical protein YTPLAS72_26930 [Nitrospira sp.]